MPRSRRHNASQRNYEKNPLQRLNKWARRRPSPSEVYAELEEGYRQLFDDVEDVELSYQALLDEAVTAIDSMTETLEEMGEALERDNK